MNTPIQKKKASERIAIENTVKELRINRSCFAEYSKTGYVQIINRFLYTFVDHKYLQKEEQKHINEVHTVKFSWVGLSFFILLSIINICRRKSRNISMKFTRLNSAGSD